MNENDLESFEPWYGWLEPVELGRPGESFLIEKFYEQKIRECREKRERLIAAIEARERNPADPRVSRAAEIVDQINAELEALYCCFLEAWRPDHLAN